MTAPVPGERPRLPANAMGGWWYEFRRKDGATFVFDHMDPHVTDLAGLLVGVKPVVYCHIEPGEQDFIARLSEFFGLRFHITDPAGSRSPMLGSRIEVFLARAERDLEKAVACWSRGLSVGASARWSALLGYPRCCVKAFAAWKGQRERHRDAGADVVPRIHAATAARTAYPFYLNDTLNFFSRLYPPFDDAAHQELLRRMDGPWTMYHVIPWHPCRYDCRASVLAGARIWEFLKLLMPAFADRLRDALARPVLSLGPWRFARLDGRVVSPRRCDYRAVLEPASLLEAECVELLRRGDRVETSPTRLTVFKSGARIGAFPWQRPLLLPFCDPLEAT